MSNIIKLFSADELDPAYGQGTEFVYFKVNSNDTIYDRKANFRLTVNETTEEITIFYNGQGQGNYNYNTYYKDKNNTEVMGTTLDESVANIIEILT